MRLIRQGCFFAAFVFMAGAVAAQTADEIVNKSVAALGGRAALSKIKSRSTTGTMKITNEAGDISGTIEMLNQAPTRMRRLIVLDLSAFGMGNATIEQRFDGTTGYLIDSMRGNSELSGSQLENLKNSVFPTPLLDYKERGTKIVLAGKEKIGERDAYALSVTPAVGPVTKLSIDAQSYLPIRAVVTLELPELGATEQATDFMDYRDVDGVKVPFLIKGTSAIQTFTITVTKVAHNVEVDPAMFAKPAAK